MSASGAGPDTVLSDHTGVTRYLVMVALGPITLIGAVRGDFHTPLDQLFTGLVGTWLWFSGITMVISYV